MKVLSIFGTRPEAIKLAPIILELKERGVEQVVCVTGQQREMLDQMLNLFKISPDYDLQIMQDRQSLEDITVRSLSGLKDILLAESPDIVLVQGDTTTAMVGALAAFYHKIPVAHVEAGLRTENKYNPFPEEMNRRVISQLADYHFAPTPTAKMNLLKEGVKENSIHVSGNTVIDALLWVSKQNIPATHSSLRELDDASRIVLVTTHRRENLGEGMEGIFQAVLKLSIEYPDLTFLFPVHLNPRIQEHAKKIFTGRKNIILTEPFGYSDLVFSLKKAFFVMTDSGGIQEEAPALGKPVLVLRTTTERPEGVEAGTARLIGVNSADIYKAAKRLLDEPSIYEEMAQAKNPYGDGTAAKKIVETLLNG